MESWHVPIILRSVALLMNMQNKHTYSITYERNATGDETGQGVDGIDDPFGGRLHQLPNISVYIYRLPRLL